MYMQIGEKYLKSLKKVKGTNCVFITFCHNSINQHLIEIMNEFNVEYKIENLDKNISEQELLNLIEKFNADEKIDGIWFDYLNMPNNFNKYIIFNSINVQKDILGFNYSKSKNKNLVNPLVKAILILTDNFKYCNKKISFIFDTENQNKRRVNLIKDYCIEHEIPMTSFLCYNEFIEPYEIRPIVNEAGIVLTFVNFLNLIGEYFATYEDDYIDFILVDGSLEKDEDGNIIQNCDTEELEDVLDPKSTCLIQNGVSPFQNLVDIATLENILKCKKTNK
ncbi:hypothetical protein BFS06_11485 [Clostridium perfringens]|uniref:tetrahydrofolate dehydrogenase/cyclohydrolase catalytic domain-containing protein n=1 Tax=Clostridium perfringens TaxID=1502 RepID=UPI00103B8C99|nr:tetrahydrofolate dehydrogenase/cyclohydrolase catalytic domain-containing protein [Clostridium perfringens]TBX14836.1 hypothetical protein BFS06_11485 [Clostridium perfringens]